MELVIKLTAVLLILLLALSIAERVYEEVGPLISAKVGRRVDAAYAALLSIIKGASRSNALKDAATPD